MNSWCRAVTWSWSSSALTQSYRNPLLVEHLQVKNYEGRARSWSNMDKWTNGHITCVHGLHYAASPLEKCQWKGMDTFLFELSMKWMFTFKNFRKIYWQGEQHSGLTIYCLPPGAFACHRCSSAFPTGAAPTITYLRFSRCLAVTWGRNTISAKASPTD